MLLLRKQAKNTLKVHWVILEMVDSLWIGVSLDVGVWNENL